MGMWQLLCTGNLNSPEINAVETPLTDVWLEMIDKCFSLSTLGADSSEMHFIRLLRWSQDYYSLHPVFLLLGIMFPYKLLIFRLSSKNHPWFLEKTGWDTTLYWNNLILESCSHHYTVSYFYIPALYWHIACTPSIFVELASFTTYSFKKS